MKQETKKHEINTWILTGIWDKTVYVIGSIVTIVTVLTFMLGLTLAFMKGLLGL